MKHRDYYWIILLISCILIIVLPTLITTFHIPLNCLNTDFTNTGQIGDTIGGITAPIIGLVSIILLYITFREQRYTNRWTLIENIQSKIRQTLSIHCKLTVSEYDGKKYQVRDSTDDISIIEIYSLLSNFTAYKLKMDLNEGYKLYMCLEDCYNDINLLIHLSPKSSIYQNTIQNFIKTSIEKIRPIYNAIEKGYITFQLGINNQNENGKNDDKILTKLFAKDQALYNKLPTEYLPKWYKKK